MRYLLILLSILFGNGESLKLTMGGPSSYKFKALSQLSKVGGALRVLGTTSAVLGAVLQRPAPAMAGSVQDANDKLAGYKLPPLLFVPPGLTPIVSEFGRGNSKEPITNPILVQFCAPNNWIAKTTNVNANGEAGTISAGDYIKGDSAFLFTAPGTLPTDKESISKLVQKSLSQKGDPLESFKVTNVAQGPAGFKGEKYVIADITYSLNTEAGFLIGRKGVVSLTSVGSQVQALICVTTDKRYKKLEPTLRDIAGSFRVYPLGSGIFSASS